MAPDGSVTRRTRLLADLSYEEELRARYDLPAGGAWSIDKTTESSAMSNRKIETTRHRYEVTRRYAPGEAIPPDFVRRAQLTDRAARNEIRLKVRDTLFTRRFEYEEWFRDIAAMEGFETALRRCGAAWASLLGERLAQGSEGRVDAAVAGERVEEEFEPQFTRMLAGIREQGFAFLESDLYEKELEPELADERIRARVAAAVPAPVGLEGAAWQAIVASAVKEAEEATEAQTDQLFDEETLGVHEPAGTYLFELTLSLPGVLLEHNATKREGDRLVWRFSSTDFLLRDRALRARSRLVLSGRIALAVAGAMLLLLAVLAALRKAFPSTRA